MLENGNEEGRREQPGGGAGSPPASRSVQKFACGPAAVGKH